MLRQDGKGIAMSRKVGILTSGGDCQSLNATMRAVAKSLYEEDDKVKIYGFYEGFRGLMYERYQVMKPEDFSGILTLGGTIIGTSRQPFKYMNQLDEEGNNKVELMIATYKRLQLDCVVILGGNGTHKTANLLSQRGVNIITLPKTIDNDIWGTDISFGFQSAVEVATTAIDCIHTTAASHRRVFIVEIMGHKVGWLTLHAGIAGGADIILIPEIPYDLDAVVETIQKRMLQGKKFSILAVAEGAISREDALLKKKEYKEKLKALPYPSISYKIGKEIEEQLGVEVRITVPGHTQRGGSPCSYDRVLSTRLGSAAADLVRKEQYGYMVAVRADQLVPVPLADVAGKLKYIDPNSEIIKEMQGLGISFGNTTKEMK